MLKILSLSLGMAIVGATVGWAEPQFFPPAKGTNYSVPIDYRGPDGKIRKGRSNCQKKGGVACIACCRAVKNPFGERRWSDADCAGHCRGH